MEIYIYIYIFYITVIVFVALDLVTLVWLEITPTMLMPQTHVHARKAPTHALRWNLSLSSHLFSYTKYSQIHYYTPSHLIPTKVALLIVLVCLSLSDGGVFVWSLGHSLAGHFIPAQSEMPAQRSVSILIFILRFPHHLKHWQSHFDCFFGMRDSCKIDFISQS